MRLYVDGIKFSELFFTLIFYVVNVTKSRPCVEENRKKLLEINTWELHKLMKVK
jgi:hypothetical protein